MLTLAAGAAVAFSPAAVPAVSRPAVRTESPMMLQDASSRRELFAKAGAALAGFSAVQSASAKAGQFSKIEIFSVIGEPGISSPYQPGGPKPGRINPETNTATFGYAKTEGEFAAKGYQNDDSREREAYKVSSSIVSSQGKNIESKTWWLVRDNLRGQAYNMKANMRTINSNLPAEKKESAVKAYTAFWKKIDALDLACKKKELALAQKEYAAVLELLKQYESQI